MVGIILPTFFLERDAPTVTLVLFTFIFIISPFKVDNKDFKTRSLMQFWCL